jgi:hypothetical protein
VEDHVVLGVEKQNVTFGGGKFPAQGLGELHGGKSASDDDYSCGFHGAPFLWQQFSMFPFDAVNCPVDGKN